MEKLFKAKVDDGRTDDGQRPIIIAHIEHEDRANIFRWASLYTFNGNYSKLVYFNILFILELNSEFRDFKLWDQKLLFKGFVLEMLEEYFCYNKT